MAVSELCPLRCTTCEGTGIVEIDTPCNCLGWNPEEGCRHGWPSEPVECEECRGSGITDCRLHYAQAVGLDRDGFPRCAECLEEIAEEEVREARARLRGLASRMVAVG